MIARKHIYILTVLIVVTLLSLWKIAQHDLQEWDESRNGVNAYEMLKNNDFVNYYYNNELDTWNAKPPLVIWLIAISYKLFGFNEFALRFPTFISTIVFFIFCFKTIELVEGRVKAFLSCILLISCKAVFSNHIGLTGDFDMPLTAFLTASVYYFMVYVETKKNYAICLFTLFICLAFYTKGVASFIFFPGFMIYLLIRGNIKTFIKDKKVWFSLFFFWGIIFSWVLLIYLYGKSSDHSWRGSKNSIETMVVHDTYNRFTSTSFGNINDYNPFFFFVVLDVKLNLWNYLFYLSVMLGVYKLIENRKNLKHYLQSPSNRLIILSFCIIFPIAITLSLAVNQNGWYLAPLFMFIPLVIIKAVGSISYRFKFSYFILILVFAFTFIRQLSYLYNLPVDNHYALLGNKKLQNQKIIVIDKLEQDIFLYLEWLNMNIIKLHTIDDIDKFKGEMIFLNKEKINDAFMGHLEKLYDFEDHVIAKIK